MLWENLEVEQIPLTVVAFSEDFNKFDGSYSHIRSIVRADSIELLWFNVAGILFTVLQMPLKDKIVVLHEQRLKLALNFYMLQLNIRFTEEIEGRAHKKWNPIYFLWYYRASDARGKQKSL